MSWVQIILYIILNAKAIIGVIKDIINLIKGLPKEEREKIKFPIINAILQHMKDKDDKKLSDAITACTGIACPPQPVGP